MASRNKKGKLHGIFKFEFQISFFYKPSMEGTDIYYYMVLEDILFLKLRFLQNITLIIEDLYPLTSSYMEKEYERLFLFLKGQTTITVLVSLIGNIGAFRQTCIRLDAPIVEDDRFSCYPESFYQKFKNYCGNDASRFGFFLLAFNEDTFKEQKEEETVTPTEPPSKLPKEELTTINEDVLDEAELQEEPIKQEIPSVHQPDPIPPEVYSFLTEWKTSFCLQIGGTASITRITKHISKDPDYELAWELRDENDEEDTNAVSFFLSYEVTELGHGFYVHRIDGTHSSITNLIQMLRSLMNLVDDTYRKHGTRWDITIPVSQESVVFDLLKDLKFNQIYGSGNRILVPTGNGYQYANQNTLMTYGAK